MFLKNVNGSTDVCKQVGLVLLEDPQEYSDRVCNSCARKILTLGNLFEIVKTATLPTVSGTKRSLATPEKDASAG